MEFSLYSGGAVVLPSTYVLFFFCYSPNFVFLCLQWEASKGLRGHMWYDLESLPHQGEI